MRDLAPIALQTALIASGLMLVTRLLAQPPSPPVAADGGHQTETISIPELPEVLPAAGGQVSPRPAATLEPSAALGPGKDRREAETDKPQKALGSRPSDNDDDDGDDDDDHPQAKNDQGQGKGDDSDNDGDDDGDDDSDDDDDDDDDDD